MYIATGQGQTAPGDKILMSTNLLSLWSFATSFKKNLFEVWFYPIFFMILYMYIAAGPLGDEILMSTGTSCHFGHVLQVSKKSLRSLILYHFFMILYMYIAPGAGADSPQGTKVWCQQLSLVTSFICCKFQKNVFEVWFYTIVFMI